MKKSADSTVSAKKAEALKGHRKLLSQSKTMNGGTDGIVRIPNMSINKPAKPMQLFRRYSRQFE
jgi:hypothetical protein